MKDYNLTLVIWGVAGLLLVKAWGQERTGDGQQVVSREHQQALELEVEIAAAISRIRDEAATTREAQLRISELLALNEESINEAAMIFTEDKRHKVVQVTVPSEESFPTKEAWEVATWEVETAAAIAEIRIRNENASKRQSLIGEVLDSRKGDLEVLAERLPKQESPPDVPQLRVLPRKDFVSESEWKYHQREAELSFRISKARHDFGRDSRKMQAELSEILKQHYEAETTKK